MRAEGERRGRLQLRADAELLRHLGDRLRSDVERKPRVHGVVRVNRGRGDRFGAGIRAVVRPDAPLERRVEERRGKVARRPGVHPVRDRGGQDDGLERRARLPLSRRHEVELVAPRAGCDGRHRTDRTRGRVDGDDRAGRIAA